MTLTKADIVESIIAQIGVPRPEARQIVDELFEEVRVCLSAGEIVKLSGFGNFELRDKASRPGRNPKTGENVPVSARRVVVFRPGQKLRARVEKTKPKD